MIMQANLFLSRLLTVITSAKSLSSCKVTYHRHWGHIWGSLKCLLQRCIQVSQLVSSVTQLCPALWSHGLQHTRPPCLSPTPGACSSSCPSSRWCHPTISSSVVSFSSCLQSFLASGSFPVSQLFAPGGQSWSFSFSISPSNEYSGLISFRIDWFDLLAVQGDLLKLAQTQLYVLEGVKLFSKLLKSIMHTYIKIQKSSNSLMYYFQRMKL